MKNNFRLLAVALGFISVMPAFAQKENVGIGTSNPDQSAVLDISSSSKGLLMPRMSFLQREAIQKPAQGLVIYQTDVQSGFYFYNGKEWKALEGEKSVAGVDGDWTLVGNAPTPGDGSFLGTTNNTPLEFKTSGVRAGFIDKAYGGTFNTFFGTEAGILSTGNSNIGIGFFSLKANTTGYSNAGIGAYSLEKNVDGYFNAAIGSNALGNNVSGNNNMAIGPASLRLLQSGSNNTAIGAYGLYSNVSGSGNVGIGYNAGYNETSSNKLYIANSNTDMPLIYGDFSAKFVAIGDVPASTLKRSDAATSGGYNLLVKGGILTEKVKVALVSTTDWADYVFEPSYKEKMMSLEEVEKYTISNKHLPNVPSAQDMVEKGMEVGQTSKMFMEKIEELTLYMIQLNKEVKALKAENEALKKK